MENITELVNQAKNGSEIAFSQLCDKYAPLINSMALKHMSMCKNEGGSLEDFLQEAKIALYNAIVSYNFDKGGVTFGAYARTVIRNKLVSLVRHMNSKKRKKRDLEISCNEVTPQDKVVWRELGEVLSERVEMLSPYEKRVFNLLKDGLKAKEISKRVGKSEKSVNNAIFRIRSKLKGVY